MTDAARRPWTDAERAAVARFRPSGGLPAAAVVSAVAWSSRLLMRVGNHVDVDGAERLAAARASSRGLLTFSNHVSLFDDPWLTACLTHHSGPGLRWIAADALNFFANPLSAWVFSAGRCVPIVRGVGLDQPGMHFLADRLRAGDWVHVFPEGGRTRRDGAQLQTPFKPGLAWLTAASRPVLLPFVHRGMGSVLPVGARLPRLGVRVRVLVGDAVDAAAGLADEAPGAITAWAEQALATLAARVHPPP